MTAQKLPSDAELVRSAKAGDADAFGELVERNEAKIYGLCLKMLGNQEDAEDCLQEVFIKAFKALPGFRGEARFSTWTGGVDSRFLPRTPRIPTVLRLTQVVALSGARFAWTPGLGDGSRGTRSYMAPRRPGGTGLSAPRNAPRRPVSAPRQAV